MAEAKSLEKEIKYWSVLIQRHKNASEHGQKGRKKAEISSKYSWKKIETNNKRTSDSQVTGINSTQNAVKKMPQGPDPASVMSSQPTVAKRAKVAIDSKFKWSKSSSSSMATTARDSSPSEVTHFVKGKMSTAAPAKSDAGKKFNPKFKWTKASAQQPAPTVADRKLKLKAMDGPAKRTNVASTSASPLNKSPYMLLPRSRQHIFNCNSGPRTHWKGRFPSKNVRELHAGHGRHPLAVIKGQRENALKWNKHQHGTWHAKRSGTRGNIGHSAVNCSKHASVNPYKLNRLSKPSSRPHSRRLSPSPKPTKAQAFFRSSNKVLDRRQVKVQGGKRGAEGQGAHFSGHVPTVKQVLASRVLQRSHHAAMLKSKRDAKKQHCLYFGRFGKCMRGDSCKFIHDPSRVAVCTRFLRGTCRDENCSFSHKLEKEKTPVCLFFIRGKCTATNCPYLHVYLGKNAPVCRKFALNGFCEEADQCKALHIKCCPEFYETGSCDKEKDCKLPHFARNVHSSAKPEKNRGGSKNETQDTNLQQRLDLNPGTSAGPSASSTPDFLSLKVDSPQPLNKPLKGKEMQIKPRFGKLKLKKQPQ